MNPRLIIFIDSIFWLPKILLENIYYQVRSRIKVKKANKNSLLIIKFLGLGNLVKLAIICDELNLDKNQITVFTLNSHKVLLDLIGFENYILINTRSLGSVFSSLYRVRKIIERKRISHIIDIERSSNAVSIIRMFLAVRSNIKTISVASILKNRKHKNDFVWRINEVNYLQKILSIAEKKPQLFKKKLTLRNPFKLLININASNYIAERKYPITSFYKLIKLLLERDSNLEIYLTGSKSEHSYVSKLTKMFSNQNNRIKNVAGVWGIRKLMDELGSCALFITNDSGPMHLSVLQKTETIVLWGPTQVKNIGYLNKPYVHNLSLNLDCAPCFQNPKSNIGLICKGEISCLKNLSHITVLNTAIKVLGLSRK